MTIAVFALSGAFSLPLYAGSTQLQVVARVLPSKAVAAAQSTINIIFPEGIRRPLDLSAAEKLAVILRKGALPAAVLAKIQVSGTHVIEINY